MLIKIIRRFFPSPFQSIKTLYTSVLSFKSTVLYQNEEDVAKVFAVDGAHGQEGQDQGHGVSVQRVVFSLKIGIKIGRRMIWQIFDLGTQES